MVRSRVSDNPTRISISTSVSDKDNLATLIVLDPRQYIALGRDAFDND